MVEFGRQESLRLSAVGQETRVPMAVHSDNKSLDSRPLIWSNELLWQQIRIRAWRCASV
jgi:hypothetical protein